MRTLLGPSSPPSASLVSLSLDIARPSNMRRANAPSRREGQELPPEDRCLANFMRFRRQRAEELHANECTRVPQRQEVGPAQPWKPSPQLLVRSGLLKHVGRSCVHPDSAELVEVEAEEFPHGFLYHHRRQVGIWVAQLIVVELEHEVGDVCFDAGMALVLRRVRQVL
jgi:hypothetical protein